MITVLFVLSIFSDSSSKMYLHELLTGSEVYVEPLKLPEKVYMYTLLTVQKK